MKIIRIIGGIGNQMFQYAFALSLQKHFPTEIVLIDTSLFNGYALHNGYELGRVFGVDLPIATGKDIRKVSCYIPNYKWSRLYRKIFGYRKTEFKEPRLFDFWGETAFAIDRDCYYEGSWQNEKYFKDFQNEIREAFSFKQPLSEMNLNVLDEINENNSVSIHVRRGDYLNDPAYQGVCDVPYYTNAIRYIKKRVEAPFFFIFSNDIDWCQEHITPLCDKYKIIGWNSGKDSWADMQLMSLCKHNIIAHSSFSWWGAWLNAHESKIVVAPRGWYNEKGITESPQLEDWILCDNQQTNEE